MHSSIRTASFLVLLLCLLSAQALELPPNLAAFDPVRWDSAALAAEHAERHGRPARHREDLSELPCVRQRTWGIILANAAAVGLYGKSNWWQDGFTGRFRTVNEGWFGQHTYSGGADKLGHLYMNYASTRLFARAFEWAGNEPERSRTLAAWLTLGTFSAVEVLDGFSKRWRFSKEDAIMNAVGVGTAWLLETNPTLDRIIDLRLLYRPSRDDRRHFDPFGDYAGQTYLIVAKASGIPALRRQSWLRYLELAVGYGTRGYSTSPADGGDGRSRYMYAGISINLSEVLNDTAFKRSAEARRAQRVTDTFLEFVQVPGTAALARTKLRVD